LTAGEGDAAYGGARPVVSRRIVAQYELAKDVVRADVRSVAREARSSLARCAARARRR